MRPRQPRVLAAALVGVLSLGLFATAADAAAGIDTPAGACAVDQAASVRLTVVGRDGTPSTSVVGESCSTVTLGIPADADIGGGFIDIAVQPIAYDAEFGRTIRINGDGTEHGWSNHYLDADGVAVVRVSADTQLLEIRWQSVDATTNATAIEYGLIAALRSVAIAGT